MKFVNKYRCQNHLEELQQLKIEIPLKNPTVIEKYAVHLTTAYSQKVKMVEYVKSSVTCKQKLQD